VFTGIVEEVGTIDTVERLDDARRLVIRARRVLEDVAEGDSIAIDGVCQTVVAIRDGAFDVQAIGTTLSRTTFGSFERGRKVNLERSLAFGGRMGGHLVQGHVDAVGVVESVARAGEHVRLDVRVPELVGEVTVLHGSIAINGVSLTVNELSGDVVQVALIPYTWEHTALSELVPGAEVNLEGDLFGKFVVQYLKRTGVAGVIHAIPEEPTAPSAPGAHRRA
jgi:riboflavin synthase